MFSRLEKEFRNAIRYVALETVHNNVWSEKFGELLIRTGDLVDSFFRIMVDSKSLDNENTVIQLRAKIHKERQQNPNWSPNINDFRETFEPIFRLSNVEVEADYGLTYYGKLQPFKDFAKVSPSWWLPYNKVKHEIFEQMEKTATLANVINTLGALFGLNILHLESRKYLIRHTNVISREFLSRRDLEKFLSVSFIGGSNNAPSFQFIAKTTLFTHVFRIDSDPSKKV